MSLDNTQSIRKFYAGSDVFLTGATGFIGKALVEKLLRSCPRIGTIYVLTRSRKNQTQAQRIEQMTNGLLFDQIREENPDAFIKIHAIQGDMMELGLGISEDDFQKIKSCSVIFHAAASVRFDDPLKAAIILNTRGTREICELAKKMPNLKALVHVSTAYIQPRNFHVKEILYDTDADWKTYIKYAENLEEDLINYCTPKLTKFAPNTYTFTKHMAERVCVDYKKEFHLPIVIYRPSIVSLAETEPVSGWCDNLNGPMGLIMVAALGINHVMNMPGTNKLNIVPVDICIKGIIVCAWKQWKDQQATFNEIPIPVYNAASIKIISYDSMKYDVDNFVSRNPSINSVGLPSITFTPCVPYSWIIRIFRNILPALIIDAILLATRQKTRLMKVNRIIYNADTSLRHFYSNNFTIDNYNFCDLTLIVPPVEKDEFSLTEKVSANTGLYFNGYKLLLKIAFGETENDLKIARKRYPYMYYITKFIHGLIFFVIFKILYDNANKWLLTIL